MVRSESSLATNYTEWRTYILNELKLFKTIKKTSCEQALKGRPLAFDLYKQRVKSATFQNVVMLRHQNLLFIEYW